MEYILYMTREYAELLEDEATRERPTDDEFEELLAECDDNGEDPQKDL